MGENLNRICVGRINCVAEVHPIDEIAREAEEEIEAPAEEESETVQRLPTPDMPKRSEVLDHRATHDPFRAWCPHCVEGRAAAYGHHACPPKAGRGTPTVSFDCCFVGN